jgi:hypothetical protein
MLIIALNQSLNEPLTQRTSCCQKWGSEGPIVAMKDSKEPGAKGPWRIEQPDSEKHGKEKHGN